MSTVEQQGKAPPDLRNVVSFLRSGKAGMKIRVGALNGKRVDYFKGKSAVKALLSPAYAALSNVPKVTSESEASALLHSIIPYAFFLRVERSPSLSSSSSSPKVLSIIPAQLFTPTDYYAWFYEGSQWTTTLGGLLMVAVMLGGVMFPLWPPVIRLGVWWLSIAMLGLIGLFFAMAIVRLVFYVGSVIVASPGIWIFPKLFADVGFVESFIPLWEWDIPKKKTKKKRGDNSDKDKGKRGSKGKAPEGNGGAFIEEVDDSADSRPASRGVTVEDVDDDE